MCTHSRVRPYWVCTTKFSTFKKVLLNLVPCTLKYAGVDKLLNLGGNLDCTVDILLQLYVYLPLRVPVARATYTYVDVDLPSGTSTKFGRGRGGENLKKYSVSGVPIYIRDTGTNLV